MTLPASREGWDGLRVVVHGFGADGAAAADNLLFLGAEVTVLDEQAVHDTERAELLRTLGARIELGEGATADLPECALVIAGAPAEGPLEEQADTRGVPVWSDAELAWRLRGDDGAPWLVAAGSADPAHPDALDEIAPMLVAIAHEAGLRAVAAGSHAVSLAEATMDPERPDLLAVWLTAAQLRRSESIRAESAVVLTGDDQALGRVYERVRLACVYHAADPRTEQLVMDADVEHGARAIGLTLDTPAVSMLGIVEDMLVDRAFIAERRTSAAELATLHDLGGRAADQPAYVLSALAAAALARAHGLSQQAVRDGLRAYAGPVDSSDDE